MGACCIDPQHQRALTLLPCTCAPRPLAPLQVLPMRTHPSMNMNHGHGFILSGTVLAHEAAPQAAPEAAPAVQPESAATEAAPAAAQQPAPVAAR